jgi:hypothetical protein
MNYVSDWSNYNIKFRLDAERYVDDNFSRLKSLLNEPVLCDDSILRDDLVEYFTKCPDQIPNYSYKTIGRPLDLKVPKLMNIGGVYKYR